MGRKKTSRIRRMRAAARKKLSRLLDRQSNRCHFCGEAIIEVATIPAKRRLSTRNGCVRWLDHQGQARECRIATVEHIIPLGENGQNTDWNLVAACERCNNGRNHARQLEKNGKEPLGGASLAGAAGLVVIQEVQQVRFELADVNRSIELLRGRLADLAAENAKQLAEWQGRLGRLRRKQRWLESQLKRLVAKLSEGGGGTNGGNSGMKGRAEAG